MDDDDSKKTQKTPTRLLMLILYMDVLIVFIIGIMIRFLYSRSNPNVSKFMRAPVMEKVNKMMSKVRKFSPKRLLRTPDSQQVSP